MTLPLPRQFNAAAYFVDRNVEMGRGGRVAIVCEGQGVTYAELWREVVRVGGALRALGVRMEERVALVMQDGPAFAAAFWGAMRIGAVPVPVSTMLTPADYAYVLDDCRARVVVVSEPLAAAVEGVRPRLAWLERLVVARGTGVDALDELTRHTPDTPEAPNELPPAPTTADDAAFWLYTSGTTGTPKAAIHLHHDMVVCCEAFGRHVLEIGEDDRCLSVAKLFFAYGLGNALYYPFGVGARSILIPGRPEPELVFETITRERPTLFFAVPTAYAALLRVPDAERRFDLSSVRLCLSAGEPLPKPLYERWRERFGLELLDGIGSTEMCNTFIANRRGAVRPGSSGRVVPGYEARVVDDAGRDVPDGEVGHLLVKGDSAFAGYWNRHERTTATLLGAWVRTGDQYRRDADGYYWYVGRSDDLIKAGGIAVAPAEVEAALLEHAAVAEVGVAGLPDGDGLLKPVAFVVPAAGHAPSDSLGSELIAFARDRLAHFKCPRRVCFVDALPKTATGKVRRYKLREWAGARLRADGSGE